MSLLISILSLNRREGARECVEKVIECTAGMENVRVVLTDNGSTDSTEELFDDFAQAYSGVTVFHEPENLGFQEPHNRAFRIAAREGFAFFLCLNDDVLISENTIERLLAPFRHDAKLALCGHTGGCSELLPNFHGKPGQFEYVEASCLMIRVALVATLRENLFSPHLDFAYGEDSDLSLLVRERGFRIAQVDAGVKHRGSQTSHSTPELRERCRVAQEHNHAYLKNRWAHYLKVRRMEYPIVIRRMGALGDVILATALVRAIRRDFPLASIFVETRFPQVFDNSPRLTRAKEKIQRTRDCVEINLDGAYEDRPLRHVIDSYAEVARTKLPGLGEVEHRTELFSNDQDRQRAERMMPGDNWAVIHTDGSHWPGKKWPEERLREVVRSLKESGMQILTAGNQVSNVCWEAGGPNYIFGGSMGLAAFCRRAKLFVGEDSAPWHVAQAMGCPTVVVFGCTRSRYLATHGSRHIAVESDENIPGSGERHRSVGQISSSANGDCMNSITSAQVIAAIQKI